VHTGSVPKLPDRAEPEGWRKPADIPPRALARARASAEELSLLVNLVSRPPGMSLWARPGDGQVVGSSASRRWAGRRLLGVEEEEEEEGLYLQLETRERVQTNEAKYRRPIRNFPEQRCVSGPGTSVGVRHSRSIPEGQTGFVLRVAMVLQEWDEGIFGSGRKLKKVRSQEFAKSASAGSTCGAEKPIGRSRHPRWPVRLR
jgi:hypothetical protein